MTLSVIVNYPEVISLVFGGKSWIKVVERTGIRPTMALVSAGYRASTNSVRI